MKFIKLITSLGINALWLSFLLNPSFFGLSIPPIGKILNPFSGFWQQAEKVERVSGKEIDLKGLQAKGKVIFDERMVPHIFAPTNNEAFYLQGYIEAMLRLWQMDISVRSAGGTLSEILGERTLSIDIGQRKKRMIAAAKTNMEVWKKSGEEWSAIEAYTNGVNAYIDQLTPAQYPLEFKLLDYEPTPWTPLKSVLFFMSMVESLNFQHSDIKATNSFQLLGSENFSKLFPEWNPKQVPVISEPALDYAMLEVKEEPKTTNLNSESVSLSPPQGKIYDSQTAFLAQPPLANGSNNWAISGQKSKSGYPILANDPHLFLTLPAIWMETQIQTPEINAYGASLPGLPGIVIGFNEQSAWGLTNVGQDVLDWYEITWQDENKNAYWLDGEWVPVENIIEEIVVKGRKIPVEETIKVTKWGPVVSFDEKAFDKDLAMHWLSHQPLEERPFYEIGAFIRMMKNKGYEDYREAILGFSRPAQNFLYASNQGDIALTVTGKLPIKERGQGRLISPGDKSTNGWKGFIPFESLPYSHNPPSQYVASANQHSTDPAYPYYYNGGFDDYRGRYINRILSREESLGVEDFMKIQNDNYSIYAEEGLPALLALLDGHALQTENEKNIFAQLKEWSYSFEAKESAPVYFLEWMNKTYRWTFDELENSENQGSFLMPENWVLIDLLQNQPSDPIFDRVATTELESAQDLVTASFLEMAAEISAPVSWEEYKGTQIQHLGRIAPLGSELLNVGGFADALNAIKKGHGPSWRMIVELGPKPKACGVYPGGQSGNPGSPFYDFQIQNWVEGKYYPLNLYSSAEEAAQFSFMSYNFE
jgi:penicillin amidase